MDDPVPCGMTEAELKHRTLANLYNERLSWLDFAHRKLDEAVFNAYGWPHDLSEVEILGRSAWAGIPDTAG